MPHGVAYERSFFLSSVRHRVPLIPSSWRRRCQWFQKFSIISDRWLVYPTISWPNPAILMTSGASDCRHFVHDGQTQCRGAPCIKNIRLILYHCNVKCISLPTGYGYCASAPASSAEIAQAPLRRPLSPPTPLAVPDLCSPAWKISGFPVSSHRTDYFVRRSDVQVFWPCTSSGIVFS